MKNMLYISVLLFMASCGLPEKAPRTEKIGKLEAIKADMKKFRFEVKGKQPDAAVIPYGSSVTLLMEGVEGFKETKGRINCDASIEVFNAKNESIVYLDKLFDEKYPNGIPVEKFKGTLELSLKCQRPVRISETQKIVFTLKDKDSESKLIISENFLLAPSTGLTYTEKGLRSDGFFLHRNSEQSALTENVLAPGDTLYAYCSGVTGMEPDNNMVWPDASIALYTEQGEVLAEFKDLYKDYEKEGADADVVQELLSMQLITPPTLQPKTKYYVLFYIGDKKGPNSLNARFDFVTE
jgi:hypothetical protein